MKSNIPANIIDLLKDRLLACGFVGECHLDFATRLLHASDNSIYEVLPLAVVQPAHIQDLQLLIQIANEDTFKSLHFCARGGGTGTNGQSLTDGIVIDFSRFMTRILAFDPVEKTVIVEPGIILSELNRYLQPHGLFFAPHVSTADRATIGGMIATDAAGKGSLVYGKTADHVLGVHFILADGRELNTISGQPEEMMAAMRTLLAPTAIQAEIAARFPPIKRPLSGYNIRQCYQHGQVDLNYLMTGSEGTLGLLAAAKLKLLPIPRYKALIVVHYTSFLAALTDASFLSQFQPLAIEAIDEKVQQSAQSLPNWPLLAKWLNIQETQNTISNFIELVADTQQKLAGQIERITAALQAKGAHFITILDSKQMNQLWQLRSLAVGLAGNLPGTAKPVAFIEDAIVPLPHLAAFVAELQQQLAAYQLNYAMYGHVDVGCIHVRPALNLQQAQDRQLIRPITTRVIKLLNKYQGILWGEHGKGYRGEFVPEVFGPILYPLLCQIKQYFDPHNRLNPGKLVHPQGQPLIRIETVPMRGQFDQIIPQAMQQQFTGVMRCNGNAACLNQATHQVMCPSYQVTQNKMHSPKGRAMLVKEWMRTKALNNGQDAAVAALAFQALSGCLGCKGCAGQCPTQVSIPDVRTQFLAYFHRHYQRRTLRELLLGRIERLLLLAAKMPHLWNLMQAQVAPHLGLINIPKLTPNLRFQALLKQYQVTYYHSASQAERLPANSVVIFLDVFTGILEQPVLIATIQLLQQLGYHVAVTAPQVSGKALIVNGLIEPFKANSRRLARLLNPLLTRTIPVIALDNTITLLFRDEIKQFATPLAGKIFSLAEFLQQTPAKLPKKTLEISTYHLLPHCTEQALLPNEANIWQALFATCGAELTISHLGCCGMAGSYGHLREQQQNSAALFQRHWSLAMAPKHKQYILATGFSCRKQAAIQAGQHLFHPIEIINHWSKPPRNI